MDEYQIVELVKDRYRTGSIKAVHNFLLNDTAIISDESYERSYERNPSINNRVIGYVFNENSAMLVYTLEFPLLQWEFISPAYLYKKGYVIRGYNWLGPAPLPNLKYIIYNITTNMEDMSSTGYKFKDKLVIELIDLDVAANNLNLPKIVSSVLGPKLLRQNEINKNEFYEIWKRMRSQKLSADYTWYDAKDVVYWYFDENKRELSKEVFKISQAYERVFSPYRVVYDTKTWQPVVF